MNAKQVIYKLVILKEKLSIASFMQNKRVRHLSLGKLFLKKRSKL